MRTTPSLRPLVIGALVSLVAGIVYACLIGGAASLIFLVLGPVMAGVAIADRVIERRAQAREQFRALERQWKSLPSPQEYLGIQGPGQLRQLAWWQVGLTAPRERVIRLGEVVCRRNDVVPGAGKRQCRRVITIDPTGGIAVDGPTQLVRAVIEAFELAVAREFAPGETHPPVVAWGEGSQHARWRVDVDSRGEARLIDVLGRDEGVKRFTVDLVTPSRWGASRLLPRGRSSIGLAALDIVEHGPHALISGTTGSGKTEFLVAWLAHMSRGHGRSESAGENEGDFALAVIDFKGGGSFTRLTQHGMLSHLATDLDVPSLQAAFEGLSAQLISRERVMAEHGVAAIDEIPVTKRPARLILVVDEFRALVRAHPRWHEVLVDIAARGRALGVHLVLSTQRFGSLAADELISNIGLRIVFRPGDRAESVLLLGSAAAWERRLETGQALVALGQSDRTQLLDFSPWRTDEFVGEPTTRPAALWCEPLRERPQLNGVATVEHGLMLGLAPNHDRLAHEPVRWRPSAEGALLVVGATRSTRSDLGHLVAEGFPDAFLLHDEPALAWDALERILDETDVIRGLVAPELDACVARMPPAWRDEFIDRFMAVAHSLVGQGLPVMCGVMSEGSLSARVSHLAHIRIESSMPEPLAQWGNRSFVVARPAVRASVPAGAQPVPPSSLETLVITGRKGHWRELLTSVVRLCSVDEFLSQTYSSGLNLESTRLLIDDCSMADFRALRVSSRVLGPPHPNTVFEVTSDGRVVRWDVAGLKNRANFADRATSAKNVEVQLARDNVDVGK